MRSSARWSGPGICLVVVVSAIGLAACGFSASPRGAAADASSTGTASIDAGGTGAPTPGAGDASPALVTLRETASDAVTPGISAVCYAPGAQSTRDGTWRRVVRIADFGVAGAFRITNVSFASDHALNARGLTVRVGAYAGSFGASTLETSDITPIGSATADVPDGEAPQQVTVPLSAQVGAGAVIVLEVAAPSLQGVGHFNLGATSSAETAPGYFSSTACSFSPQSTAMLGVTGHLVIDVAGAPL